jgi:cell division protein FtsW
VTRRTSQAAGPVETEGTKAMTADGTRRRTATPAPAAGRSAKGASSAAPSGPPRPAGKRTRGVRPRGETARTYAADRRAARPRAPAPGKPLLHPPSGPGGAPGRLYLRARRAWDRPLTAYYVILGAGLLITALGLVMVFSASQIQALRYGLPSTYYFNKQLVAAVLGGVLLLAATRMPVALHRACSYPLLAGSVFLLGLVQVPGIGVAVQGNQNWLPLFGPFQLQPSEFGKLALVMWGADLLARKREKGLLTQWRHLLVPLVPVALLLLGLIMMGGDMGTAVIVAGIVLGLLWLAGAPTRLFASVLGVGAVLGALLVYGSPNRMARLQCLGATDPSAGAADPCWQAVHGIYALASGGLLGSGLGASVEKWGQLPEPHNDFIFAVTGEELGLAGTLSVLVLFAALGYAGIRVAGRTEDPFVRYAAGGVTTWISVQAGINIGAVLGLLPIAGVPLPLFSYGGSALLPTMFAVGLLIAFARGDPAARAALAARQPVLGGMFRRGRAGRKGKTMRRRAGSPPSGER